MQIAPWTCSNSCTRSLGRKNRGGGGACRPDSGEGARQRLGGSGGGDRRGRELPHGVLGACCDVGRQPAWLGNERGNDVNAMERGKHEHR